MIMPAPAVSPFWNEKRFICGTILGIVGTGEVKMKQIWRILAAAGLAGAAGGVRRGAGGEPVTVAALAERLADPLWLARLDQPDTRMHTSYDRTGGNDDFGTFLRDSQAPGWKVLVDLKGPGFVSRFWFTGAKDGYPHRFRFYFDGEETPRLEGDVKELFGGRARRSWRRWRNTTTTAGIRSCRCPTPRACGSSASRGPAGAKPYYQISESALPRGTPVETFAWPLPERDVAALEQARAIWAANRCRRPARRANSC
jgi:hypothetical protein